MPGYVVIVERDYWIRRDGDKFFLEPALLATSGNKSIIASQIVTPAPEVVIPAGSTIVVRLEPADTYAHEFPGEAL